MVKKLLLILFVVLTAGQLYSGVIKIDGSSTVFPIMEAVAEEFQKTRKGVKITIGISGTGGGFKKFSRGETDINNASRRIKETEIEACKKNKIKYLEIPIAYDGLAVVVHPKNKWVDGLTIDELKFIWQPESEGKIKRWRDVKATFPDRPLSLYGPGTDSGTFDYFTERVVGSAGKSRGDYTASEDDHILVHGVSTDENSLGYFGLAYYFENKDKLKILAIDEGKGYVYPTEKTVRDGTYPLSRPLYIYVNVKSLKRKEVKNFVKFLLANAEKIVKEIGYVPLSEREYKALSEKIK